MVGHVGIWGAWVRVVQSLPSADLSKLPHIASRHGVPNQVGQGVTQSRVGAVPHPGDISVGPDQHGQ